MLARVSMTIALIFCAVTVQGEYYYSDGRQIPLTVDSSKALILLDGDWIYNIPEGAATRTVYQ
jgi:hypothetical protein